MVCAVQSIGDAKFVTERFWPKETRESESSFVLFKVLVFKVFFILNLCFIVNPFISSKDTIAVLGSIKLERLDRV